MKKRLAKIVFRYPVILLTVLSTCFLPTVAKADYTLTTTAANTAFYGIGYQEGVNAIIAQDVITVGAGTMQTFSVGSVAVGGPTDHLRVMIEADSSGHPSNTALASQDVDPTSSCGQVTVILSSPLYLDPSTKYWIVLDRSGSYTTSNDFNACGDNSAGTVKSSVTQAGVIWLDGYNGIPGEINLAIPVTEGVPPPPAATSTPAGYMHTETFEDTEFALAFALTLILIIKIIRGFRSFRSKSRRYA